MRQVLAIVAVSAALILAPSPDHAEADAGESLAGTRRWLPAEAAECPPVSGGEGKAVTVGLSEWTVDPSPASASPGKIAFSAINRGTEMHELVIVKGDKPAALPVKDRAVDEGALPKGAFIGEIEDVPAGGACSSTFELPAGPYVLFCNIVEKEPDGQLESHYLNGMRTAFVVAAAPASTPAAGAGTDRQPQASPSLARTGSTGRRLLVASGFLLAVGGLCVSAGSRRPRVVRNS